MPEHIQHKEGFGGTPLTIRVAAIFGKIEKTLSERSPLSPTTIKEATTEKKDMIYPTIASTAQLKKRNKKSDQQHRLTQKERKKQQKKEVKREKQEQKQVHIFNEFRKEIDKVVIQTHTLPEEDRLEVAKLFTHKSLLLISKMHETTPELAGNMQEYLAIRSYEVTTGTIVTEFTDTDIQQQVQEDFHAAVTQVKIEEAKTQTLLNRYKLLLEQHEQYPPLRLKDIDTNQQDGYITQEERSAYLAKRRLSSQEIYELITALRAKTVQDPTYVTKSLDALSQLVAQQTGPTHLKSVIEEIFTGYDPTYLEKHADQIQTGREQDMISVENSLGSFTQTPVYKEKEKKTYLESMKKEIIAICKQHFSTNYNDIVDACTHKDLATRDEEIFVGCVEFLLQRYEKNLAAEMQAIIMRQYGQEEAYQFDNDVQTLAKYAEWIAVLCREYGLSEQGFFNAYTTYNETCLRIFNQTGYSTRATLTEQKEYTNLGGQEGDVSKRSYHTKLYENNISIPLEKAYEVGCKELHVETKTWSLDKVMQRFQDMLTQPVPIETKIDEKIFVLGRRLSLQLQNSITANTGWVTGYLDCHEQLGATFMRFAQDIQKTPGQAKDILGFANNGASYLRQLHDRNKLQATFTELVKLEPKRTVLAQLHATYTEQYQKVGGSSKTATPNVRFPNLEAKVIKEKINQKHMDYFHDTFGTSSLVGFRNKLMDCTEGIGVGFGKFVLSHYRNAKNRPGRVAALDDLAKNLSSMHQITPSTSQVEPLVKDAKLNLTRSNTLYNGTGVIAQLLTIASAGAAGGTRGVMGMSFAQQFGNYYTQGLHSFQNDPNIATVYALLQSGTAAILERVMPDHILMGGGIGQKEIATHLLQNNSGKNYIIKMVIKNLASQHLKEQLEEQLQGAGEGGINQVWELLAKKSNLFEHMTWADAQATAVITLFALGGQVGGTSSRRQHITTEGKPHTMLSQSGQKEWQHILDILTAQGADKSHISTILQNLQKADPHTTDSNLADLIYKATQLHVHSSHEKTMPLKNYEGELVDITTLSLYVTIDGTPIPLFPSSRGREDIRAANGAGREIVVGLEGSDNLPATIQQQLINYVVTHEDYNDFFRADCHIFAAAMTQGNTSGGRFDLMQKIAENRSSEEEKVRFSAMLSPYTTTVDAPAGSVILFEGLQNGTSGFIHSALSIGNGKYLSKLGGENVRLYVTDLQNLEKLYGNKLYFLDTHDMNKKRKDIENIFAKYQENSGVNTIYINLNNLSDIASTARSSEGPIAGKYASFVQAMLHLDDTLTPEESISVRTLLAQLLCPELYTLQLQGYASLEELIHAAHAEPNPVITGLLLRRAGLTAAQTKILMRTGVCGRLGKFQDTLTTWRKSIATQYLGLGSWTHEAPIPARLEDLVYSARFNGQETNEWIVGLKAFFEKNGRENAHLDTLDPATFVADQKALTYEEANFNPLPFTGHKDDPILDLAVTNAVPYLQGKKHIHLVDCFCGTVSLGAVVEQRNEKIGIGSYLGIDIAPAGLVRDLTIPEMKGIDTGYLGTDALSGLRLLPDATADVITLNGIDTTITTESYMQKVLQEAARVLAPDGVISGVMLASDFLNPYFIWETLGPDYIVKEEISTYTIVNMKTHPRYANFYPEYVRVTSLINKLNAADITAYLDQQLNDTTKKEALDDLSTTILHTTDPEATYAIMAALYFQKQLPEIYVSEIASSYLRELNKHLMDLRSAPPQEKLQKLESWLSENHHIALGTDSNTIHTLANTLLTLGFGGIYAEVNNMTTKNTSAEETSDNKNNGEGGFAEESKISSSRREEIESVSAQWEARVLLQTRDIDTYLQPLKDLAVRYPNDAEMLSDPRKHFSALSDTDIEQIKSSLHRLAQYMQLIPPSVSIENNISPDAAMAKSNGYEVYAIPDDVKQFLLGDLLPNYSMEYQLKLQFYKNQGFDATHMLARWDTFKHDTAYSIEATIQQRIAQQDISLIKSEEWQYFRYLNQTKLDDFQKKFYQKIDSIIANWSKYTSSEQISFYTFTKPFLNLKKRNRGDSDAIELEAYFGKRRNERGRELIAENMSDEKTPPEFRGKKSLDIVKKHVSQKVYDKLLPFASQIQELTIKAHTSFNTQDTDANGAPLYIYESTSKNIKIPKWTRNALAGKLKMLREGLKSFQDVDGKQLLTDQEIKDIASVRMKAGICAELPSLPKALAQVVDSFHTGISSFLAAYDSVPDKNLFFQSTEHQLCYDPDAVYEQVSTMLGILKGYTIPDKVLQDYAKAYQILETRFSPEKRSSFVNSQGAKLLQEYINKHPEITGQKTESFEAWNERMGIECDGFDKTYSISDATIEQYNRLTPGLGYIIEKYPELHKILEYRKHLYELVQEIAPHKVGVVGNGANGVLLDFGQSYVIKFSLHLENTDSSNSQERKVIKTEYYNQRLAQNLFADSGVEVPSISVGLSKPGTDIVMEKKSGKSVAKALLEKKYKEYLQKPGSISLYETLTAIHQEKITSQTVDPKKKGRFKELENLMHRALLYHDGTLPDDSTIVSMMTHHELRGFFMRQAQEIKIPSPTLIESNISESVIALLEIEYPEQYDSDTISLLQQKALAKYTIFCNILTSKQAEYESQGLRKPEWGDFTHGDLNMGNLMIEVTQNPRDIKLIIIDFATLGPDHLGRNKRDIKKREEYMQKIREYEGLIQD